MSRPAFFIWLLSAPVLTGIGITVLLLVPAAQAALGQWITATAIGSAVVTIPFSRAVGKALA